MTALDLIVLWLCIISIGRLITYRRKGATFKRSYGIAAWLLITAIGSLAIYIVGGKICTTNIPIILPIMIIVTLILIRARGNVAQVVNIRRLLNE